MQRSNDSARLESRTPDPTDISRNLTTQDLEAVIRRAVELQAATSPRTEEGVSEDEVVRIGRELGLEPATIRRALAEVRSRPPDETGVLVALAGPRSVRVNRVLQGKAADIALLLDRHLRESELMVVHRRFPDRTRYLRDWSLAAGLTRLTRGLSRSHPRLNLEQADIAVSTIDDNKCLLEVSVDLAGMRGGLITGVLGSSGGIAAAWSAVAWATAIPDPFMLIGLPVIAGAWYANRAIYGTIRRSVEEKLESFLDRVEHMELSEENNDQP